MMRYEKRVMSLGYTMLELLLVLSLVAVMTIVSIRWHRVHVLSEQQSQASSEMQSVIAALMYYESVENAWPETRLCDDESVDSESNFVKYYLPAGVMPSTYGTNYCWQEKAKEKSQPLGLLALDLPVRGNHAVTNAKAIAALLPHGVAVGDPESMGECDDDADTCYVHTELVPVVGSAVSTAGVGIQSVGECVPDDAYFCESNETAKCCQKESSDGIHYEVRFPVCSSGYKPKVVYVPSYLQVPYQQGVNDSVPSPLELFDMGYIRDPGIAVGAEPTTKRIPESRQVSCHETQSHQEACDLPVGMGYQAHGIGVFDLHYLPYTETNTGNYNAGRVGAMYIAYCEKITEQGE